MNTSVFLWGCMSLFAGVAAAAVHVTTYDDDGTIQVDGKRTLIIGTYYSTSKDAQQTREESLKELADAGFNLVLSNGKGEDLDAINAAGLMAWVPVGTLDLNHVEESAAKLRAAVEAVRNHPAVAFLETVDEPAWTWKKAEARVPAEALVKAYPIIKELDPHHLLYTNHAPTNLVETLQQYNAGTDIVAVDIYPVNPGGLREQYALFEDGYQGDLNNIYISQVGEYTQKMRRVAGPHRPVFMVLQAFAWEMLREENDRDKSKVLYPLYPESRFMAFQSLIQGANGIVYWGNFFTPPDSPCWSDIKRVVREIADLKDVFVQRKAAISLEMRYHELGHSVDDGVQWTARRHDDKLYLFTCNADKNPCKVTISSDSFRSFAQCRVLYEDRSLELQDGAITDDWKPFDVHAYEFSGAR